MANVIGLLRLSAWMLALKENLPCPEPMMGNWLRT
jgi:hypothetical protein